MRRYPVGVTPLEQPGERVIPGRLPALGQPPRDAVHAAGRHRRTSCAVAVALITAIAAALSAPRAHAQNSVTYEVVSDQLNVPAADVEYDEGTQRTALQQVSLPWRMTVDVPSPVSPTKDGAEIRADWRPYRWPYKYVTVRIYLGDKLLCESTLDVGDATCYGSTPHRNFPSTGGQ